ncbi:hypothetical protein COO60DRAFT_1583823 [Scenedesmus sp. NREL 46B-D3]|nr:hypothetical protein COO60DRAFT_1583823 [Scenedesmus sp. NREL 46B-D3]
MPSKKCWCERGAVLLCQPWPSLGAASKQVLSLQPACMVICLICLCIRVSFFAAEMHAPHVLTWHCVAGILTACKGGGGACPALASCQTQPTLCTDLGGWGHGNFGSANLYDSQRFACPCGAEAAFTPQTMFCCTTSVAWCHAFMSCMHSSSTYLLFSAYSCGTALLECQESFMPLLQQ